MAKRKPKPEHERDTQGKPKGKERGARGSGHFVTIHEPDGGTHAVFLKGPPTKGMSHAGKPRGLETRARDAAHRADFISGGQVTGRQKEHAKAVKESHRLRTAREAHNEGVKAKRLGAHVSRQVHGKQLGFRERVAATRATRENHAGAAHVERRVHATQLGFRERLAEAKAKRAGASLKPQTRAMLEQRKPVNMGGERRDGLRSSQNIRAVKAEPVRVTGPNSNAVVIHSEAVYRAEKAHAERMARARELRSGRAKVTPADVRTERYHRLERRVHERGTAQTKASEWSPVVQATHRTDTGAKLDLKELATHRKGVAESLRRSRPKPSTEPVAEVPRRPAKGQRSLAFAEAIREHQSGEGVRKLMAERAASANPLARRGSRRSAFRPAAGTPAFRQQVEQARFEREHKAQTRATAKPSPPTHTAAAPYPAAERLGQYNALGPRRAAYGQHSAARAAEKASSLDRASAMLREQRAAAAAPARPSLREQVEKHRAAKGTGDERKFLAAQLGFTRAHARAQNTEGRIGKSEEWYARANKHLTRLEKARRGVDSPQRIKLTEEAKRRVGFLEAKRKQRISATFLGGR